jgi:5-methylcytosine-specific restriction endonuclease McrA
MERLGRPAKALTELQIRQAMKYTKSNRAACRYLNVSFPTYKLYASMYLDQETGKTLFELHLNPKGKGIPKWRAEQGDRTKLQDLLKRGMSLESYSLDKLKTRLLYENLLPSECGKCNFHEARVLDYKIPLILNFKDNNKSNWLLENLEFLCYNCYFLYVGDVFTQKQIKYLEDAGDTVSEAKQTDWELDDYFKEHFHQLGLTQREEDEGSEFIDKL